MVCTSVSGLGVNLGCVVGSDRAVGLMDRSCATDSASVLIAGLLLAKGTIL